MRTGWEIPKSIIDAIEAVCAYSFAWKEKRRKAVEKEGDDKADAETEKTLAADEKKDADVKDADKKANSHNDEDAEYDEDEDVDLDLAEE